MSVAKGMGFSAKLIDCLVALDSLKISSYIIQVI